MLIFGDNIIFWNNIFFNFQNEYKFCDSYTTTFSIKIIDIGAIKIPFYHHLSIGGFVEKQWFSSILIKLRKMYSHIFDITLLVKVCNKFHVQQWKHGKKTLENTETASILRCCRLGLKGCLLTKNKGRTELFTPFRHVVKLMQRVGTNFCFHSHSWWWLTLSRTNIYYYPSLTFQQLASVDSSPLGSHSEE